MKAKIREIASISPNKWFTLIVLREPDKENEMRTRHFFMLLLSLSIFGCSLPIRVEDHAIRTNQIAWQVHQEMILLNILRARDHKPMLFTSLNQIRGSLKYTLATGSIPVLFGGDATRVYGINPSATLESNPTFDVSILDNEEFYRGILSPISIQTLGLYFSQGWPKELILVLAIENYPECSSNTGCSNDPGVESEYLAFLEKIVRRKDVFEVEKVSADSGLIVDGAALENFDLYNALQDGYGVIRISENKFEVKNPASFVLKGPDLTGTIGLGVAVAMENPHTLEQHAHLRSPQGMVYYLGEVLRYKNYLADALGKGKRGFVVECNNNSEAEDYELSVIYDGQRCGIPRSPGEDADNSLRTLSFVSQLIGLSKSADSLPTTGAVQVIN